MFKFYFRFYSLVVYSICQISCALIQHWLLLSILLIDIDKNFWITMPTFHSSGCFIFSPVLCIFHSVQISNNACSQWHTSVWVEPSSTVHRLYVSTIFFDCVCERIRFKFSEVLYNNQTHRYIVSFRWNSVEMSENLKNDGTKPLAKTLSFQVFLKSWFQYFSNGISVIFFFEFTASKTVRSIKICVRNII